MGFFQTSGILNRKGFFGGDGKAFSPTDIAGLQLWLDATTGLFDATTGGNPVTTDGSAISRWEDQSGNGLHLTSISTARPILKTAIQNNKNVIRFDGINDLLSRSSSAQTFLSNKTGASVFVVRKFAISPVNPVGFFGYRGTISGSGANMILIEGGRTANKPSIGGRRLPTDGFVYIASGTNVSTTAFELQCGIIDYQNTDIYLYINKVKEAQNLNFQSSGNIGTPTDIVLNAGQPTGSGPFNGDIAEIIVYDSALLDSNRQSVENYLYNKWGL